MCPPGRPDRPDRAVCRPGRGSHALAGQAQLYGSDAPPYKYPKLRGRLNHFVEQYEAALEAGRVTSRVGGGPCFFEDEFPVDFGDWDPSKPAPSIYVEVIVEYEAVELVTVLLEDHGIPYWVSYYYVQACVPLPLLASLSELAGVRRIEVVIPFESLSPTLLEGVSWGAVKDRFK